MNNSLLNNVYEFRNANGYQTPAGLSNFPNWFEPLIGAGGKPNVRPADIDFTLHHRPFKSFQWEGVFIAEFKPAGTGELGYAQSGILEWTGKQDNSYGIYIEDNNWDLRTKTSYDAEMMSETYKITVYKNGEKKVYFRSLGYFYNAVAAWWTTGQFTLEGVVSND